ncbi:MAG: hypothetical protein LBT56_06030 [Prevotellaceae bacterium]|jgi:hypothetical protein|nr:hypothetical protein [Prevotellaceae bacterium]
MKKIYLFILSVLCSISLLTAQSSKENIINDLVASQPKIEYPVCSWAFYYYGAYDKDTYSDWILLTKEQYEELLCNQGIHCKTISPYCKDNSFQGFIFNGILSHNFSSKFLLFVLSYNTETGCSEKGFLATFTPQGNLIDTLTYYGNKSFEYNCGGIIEKDSIIIVNSKIPPQKLTQAQIEEYNINNPFIVKVYQLNCDGKFIEKREFFKNRKENNNPRSA